MTPIATEYINDTTIYWMTKDHYKIWMEFHKAKTTRQLEKKIRKASKSTNLVTVKVVGHRTLLEVTDRLKLTEANNY